MTPQKKLSQRSYLTYVQPSQIARLYAHAGNKKLALQWLERAYEERLPAMLHLGVDSDWNILRGEPGFRDLILRLHL